MRIKTEVCKGCGWKLRLETTRKQKSTKWARFAVLDVVENFQVVRYFEIRCNQRAKEKARYYVQEIMQQWLLQDGRYEIISKQVGGMGLSYDHFGGAMTLKDARDPSKYDVYVDKIYPKMKLLPVYRRNGITSRLTNIRPFKLFWTIESDSKAETLLKSNQFSLLRERLGHGKYNLDRYWPSVKICIRNNYFVKDAGIWLDYLDLLHYFRKDLHNAKYVCPMNLRNEHDRLVEKKEAIVKRQDLERRMKRVAEDQLQYEKSKAVFFGIAFTDNELEIKVLEHIEEFIKEAELHKHCVYSNRYFAKEDSLILSARVNGKPVETIEVSLSEMKVVQSRGMGNKASEYHDQILKLMNKNLRHIKKRTKSSKMEAAA